jgi:hypothetical protein
MENFLAEVAKIDHENMKDAIEKAIEEELARQGIKVAMTFCNGYAKLRMSKTSLTFKTFLKKRKGL